MTQAFANPGSCRRAPPRPLGATPSHIIESLLDTLLVGCASLPWFNDQTGRNGRVLALQSSPPKGVSLSERVMVAHRIALVDCRCGEIASHKRDVRKAKQLDGHLSDRRGSLGSRATTFRLPCKRSLNSLTDTFLELRPSIHRRAYLARWNRCSAPHYRAPSHDIAVAKQLGVVHLSSPQLNHDESATSHRVGYSGKATVAPFLTARHADVKESGRDHMSAPDGPGRGKAHPPKRLCNLRVPLGDFDDTGISRRVVRPATKCVFGFAPPNARACRIATRFAASERASQASETQRGILGGGRSRRHAVGAAARKPALQTSRKVCASPLHKVIS